MVNAPIRIEVDIHDSEVDRDVPADLDGALYRVAPDPQYPPRSANDRQKSHGFRLHVRMSRFQAGPDGTAHAAKDGK
jgi:carotenoid cleavage dioxygenase-like enzyme